MENDTNNIKKDDDVFFRAKKIINNHHYAYDYYSCDEVGEIINKFSPKLNIEKGPYKSLKIKESHVAELIIEAEEKQFDIYPISANEAYYPIQNED